MADCLRCRGACCETITLEVQAPNNDFLRFIELRSVPQQKPDGGLARNFAVACHMLVDGRCAIYPQRPQMCRAFEPGGPHCLSTVVARRSAEEVLAILGEQKDEQPD